MIKLIIFDIDGCLVNDEHRRHLLPKCTDGAAKDGSTDHGEFDDYHSRMASDKRYAFSYDYFSQLQQHYINSGDEYCFVFMTARPEKYRIETVAQLEYNFNFSFKYHIPKYMLMMREDGDMDTSPKVKYKMCIGLIAHHHTAGRDVEIIAAHDDRPDVLDMYASMKYPARLLDGYKCETWKGSEETRVMRSPFAQSPMPIEPVKSGDNPDPYAAQEPLSEHNTEPSSESASPVGSPELAEIATIFDAMAGTLRSRAADYGYNAAKVAKVMQIFFPDGVKLDSEEDHEAWHLFELVIVKLTRFVNSGLRHQDSIHDMAIYAGFVERLVAKHNIQIGN